MHCFICIYLPLLQLGVWTAEASKWSSESILRRLENHPSNPMHVARSMNISVSEHSICALERVRIQWQSSKTCGIDSLALAIVRVGAVEGNVISLRDTVVNPEGLVRQESVDELIRCDINSDHCIPKVSSITAQSESLKLVLTFDQKTTQVDILDAVAISNALYITPLLQLDGAFAAWVEPDKLEIQLSQRDLNTILAAHAAGETIEVLPRTTPRSEEKGSVTVRPTEPGDYEVVVVDRSANMAILSALEVVPQLIHVQLCDDATVLPKLPSAHKIDLRTRITQSGGSGLDVMSSKSGIDRPSVAPKRTVQVQGPVAISGLDPLKYSHQTTDPQVNGRLFVVDLFSVKELCYRLRSLLIITVALLFFFHISRTLAPGVFPAGCACYRDPPVSTEPSCTKAARMGPRARPVCG